MADRWVIRLGLPTTYLMPPIAPLSSQLQADKGRVGEPALLVPHIMKAGSAFFQTEAEDSSAEIRGDTCSIITGDLALPAIFRMQVVGPVAPWRARPRTSVSIAGILQRKALA